MTVLDVHYNVRMEAIVSHIVVCNVSEPVASAADGEEYWRKTEDRREQKN